MKKWIWKWYSYLFCFFFFVSSLLLYIYIYIYIYIRDFDPWSSHTKDSKMVLVPSLLNTQHYKVWIKGEGVSPSPAPWCSTYWKGCHRVAHDYTHQLIYIYIYLYIYYDCADIDVTALWSHRRETDCHLAPWTLSLSLSLSLSAI